MLKWLCLKMLQERAEAFASLSFTTIQQLRMPRGCLGVKTSGESSKAGLLDGAGPRLFGLSVGHEPISVKGTFCCLHLLMCMQY